MVRRSHLQSTRETRLLTQLALGGLLTSCGLLGDLKEVPGPPDTVFLPNLPGLDAGDAGDAGPPHEASTPPSDGASSTTSSKADAATDPGTSDTAAPSEAVTSQQTTAETQTPQSSTTNEEPKPSLDAGVTVEEDVGTNLFTDSGYDSDRLIGTTSTSDANSGLTLDAGDQTTVAPCGIPDPNGVPLCDPVAQCGCESGQNCAYTPTRQRRFTCVEPGETATQDACDLDDECSLGNVCSDGLCVATCLTNDDCPDDTQCVDVPTETGIEPDIRVCTKTCDPMDVDSCGQGATCAVTSDTYPTCVRKLGETGVSEDPCQSDAECEHGFGCTQDGVCRAWCSLDDKADAGPEAGVETVCPAHSVCEPHNGLDLGQCTKPCPVPDVAGSECSLLPSSCGCSADTTCHVEALGKTLCEEPGPNGYMTWCDKNSQCAAGFSCLANLCRPVCDETLPCADGSVCTRTLTSESSPLVCLGHCNPMAPSSSSGGFTPCGTGAYCSPGFGGDSRSPESHCLRGTDLQPKLAGEPCAFDIDCDNGLGCDASTETCAAWCITNNDCDNGTCDTTASVRTRNSTEVVGFCR